MQTITLTTGLPASGKTTRAIELVELGHGNTLRVNLDDIRKMLGFGNGDLLAWTKELEKTATAIQDQAILAAIGQGKNVIVDNTHLHKAGPTRIKRLFDGEIQFKVLDFTHIDPELCILRDKGRGSKAVGEDVILKMAKQLGRSWRLTEEFMNDIVLSPLYVPEPGSAGAIVVDIDGTVAKHVARSPYDYSRVSTDAPIDAIVRLVRMYWNENYDVLFMSGRPDVGNVREETEHWLRHCAIPYTELFMRPADMLTQNDADVKQYLFDKYVRSQYRVHVWLDDRDRVVRRLRKLGIKVLQVAEGNF